MREYFSHDFHSRLDSKIVSMRVDWGAEGYGMYWMLVELLHEDPSHSLVCERNALAMRTQCDGDRVMQYVQDCIRKYHLFVYDEDTNSFTSESVLGRAKVREEKSFKARKSAESRWKDSDANAMRTQCDTASDGNAIKEKKSKLKKSKLNNKEESNKEENFTPPQNKTIPGLRPDCEIFETHVYLKPQEHKELVTDFGSLNVEHVILSLSAAIENGKKDYLAYKNHALTLRKWLVGARNKGELVWTKEERKQQIQRELEGEEHAQA